MPIKAKIQKEFTYRGFENWLVRKIIQRIDQRRGELITELMRHDPTQVGPKYRLARMKRFREGVQQIIREAYAEIRQETNKNLLDLSQSINEQTVKELEQVVNE